MVYALTSRALFLTIYRSIEVLPNAIAVQRKGVQAWNRDHEVTISGVVCIADIWDHIVVFDGLVCSKCHRGRLEGGECYCSIRVVSWNWMVWIEDLLAYSRRSTNYSNNFNELYEALKLDLSDKKQPTNILKIRIVSETSILYLIRHASVIQIADLHM